MAGCGYCGYYGYPDYPDYCGYRGNNGNPPVPVTPITRVTVVTESPIGKNPLFSGQLAGPVTAVIGVTGPASAGAAPPQLCRNPRLNLRSPPTTDRKNLRRVRDSTR